MGAFAVLLCALDVLGRSPGTLPPFKFVALPPPGVSANAEGFVRTGEPVIYIVTSAPAFRDARCEVRRSMMRLASVVAHEEWHIKHGDDERGAYEAQLSALLRVGAGMDSFEYRGVMKSMNVVLKSKSTSDQAPPTPGAQADGTLAADLRR